MAPKEYAPPFIVDHIFSQQVGPEGHVSSMTAAIRDARGRLFSLHVATLANVMAAAREFTGDPYTGFEEPTFVAPGQIDETFVDSVVTRVGHSLLSQYLIPQPE